MSSTRTKSKFVNGAGCDEADQCVMDEECEFKDGCEMAEAARNEEDQPAFRCVQNEGADCTECGDMWCERKVQKVLDAEHPSPWWYWFRIELPPRTNRGEFIGLLLMIIATEVFVGFVLGIILRGMFGWPF